MNDDGKLNAGDWDYALKSSSATGGLFAIELGGEGDVTESHVQVALRRPPRPAPTSPPRSSWAGLCSRSARAAS